MEASTLHQSHSRVPDRSQNMTVSQSVSTSASDAVLDLVRELVRYRSITPEDAGVMPFLEKRLKASGFQAEYLPSGGVSNVWLRRGNTGPLVVFAGHTDVVPTGPVEAWTHPPFEAVVADGRLHGRGSADMKSSIAAFVVAVEEFVQAHPDHPGSIALLLTSDEEGPAVDGTVHVCRVLRERGIQLDYCIVGEPTSTHQLGDTLKNGRRGSLSGHLTIRGIQGHVAYPHLARNPVHQSAAAIHELAHTVWDDGNEYFPPTTFQISNYHAGTGAPNIIPGTAEIDFNFRFSTASTVEGLKARVEEILQRHGLDFTISWTLSGNPYLTPVGTLSQALTQAIEAELGVTPQLSTDGGTSDGRFIAEICPQVIEFGPINATIHKVNECIDVNHLLPLKNVYRRTLESLLGGPEQ